MPSNTRRQSLLLCFGLLAASAVQAQTCASPTALPNSPPSAAGNTCATTNDLSTLCGLFPSPDNDVVIRFAIDVTRTATTITLSTSTPTWNFRAFLLQGSCGSASTCADAVDNLGEGGSEVVPVASLGNGFYYLVVDTSGDTSTANCGAFTAVANGTLPVQLRNFSID